MQNLIARWSPLGVQPSYVLSLDVKTSLAEMFAASAKLSVAAGRSISDCFDPSAATAICQSIIDNWFNPSKTKSRITRQYLDIDVVAKQAGYPDRPDLAQQVLYLLSRAGLITRDPAHTVRRLIPGIGGTGKVMSASQFISFGCFALFYQNEFVPTMLDAGDRCSLIVAENIKNHQLLGVSSLYELTNTISRTYTRLALAATRGGVGVCYETKPLSDAITAALCAVSYGLTGLGAIGTEYALAAAELDYLQQYANLWQLVPSTGVDVLAKATPLIGAIRILKAGVEAANSLGFCPNDQVSAVIADACPYVMIKQSSMAAALPTPDLSALSASQDFIIDLIPAPRGVRVAARNDASLALYGAVRSEWSTLADALRQCFSALATTSTWVPSVRNGVYSTVKGVLNSAAFETKRAFVRSIGEMRYDSTSASMIYRIPTTLETKVVAAVLGSGMVSDYVETPDIDTAATLALVASGGAPASDGFRSPFTGQREISPLETYSKDLLDAVAADSSCYTKVVVKEFVYALPVPGSKKPAAVAEPGAFQPFGYYGDKFLVLHDGRRFLRASAASNALSTQFDDDEVVSVFEEDLFSYAVEFLKRSKKLYGDRVNLRLEQLIGTVSPTATAADRRTRELCLLLGSADLYLRSLSVCDRALGTLINKMYAVAKARAKQQKINLVREAL